MPLAFRVWRPTADQVRALREDLALSYTAFAVRLRVSRRTAIRYEQGDVAMTSKRALRNFKRLAREAGWRIEGTQGKTENIPDVSLSPYAGSG
jgi:predicted transcriptional regulator